MLSGELDVPDDLWIQAVARHLAVRIASASIDATILNTPCRRHQPSAFACDVKVAVVAALLAGQIATVG